MSIESEKQQPKSLNRIARTLALSAALHTPALEVEFNLSENVPKIAYSTKERLKRLIYSSPKKREAYINTIQEEGQEPDLKEFYIEVEEIEGAIDAETKIAAEQEMMEQVDRLRLFAENEEDKIKVLQEITDYAHEENTYEAGRTSVARLFSERKGNCRARQKATAMLAEAIYPDLKIVSQSYKVDGEPHTRTLVQIDGSWHAMEGDTSRALSQEELEGTVIHEKNSDIKNYAGQKSEGTYIAPTGEGKEMKTKTKFSVNDEFLGNEMPVEWDRVRNVDTQTNRVPQPEKPTELIIDWDKYSQEQELKTLRELKQVLVNDRILSDDRIDDITVEHVIELVEFAWQDLTEGREVEGPMWEAVGSPYTVFTQWSRANKGKHEDIMRLANIMVDNNRTFYLGGVLVNTTFNCDEFNGLSKKITDPKALETIKNSQESISCEFLSHNCGFDFFEIGRQCRAQK